MILSRRFSCLAPALLLSSLLGPAAADPQPETLITEPVSVAQYEDAIVLYLHGFDLALTRFPELQLDYRLILPDGTVGDAKVLNLTEPWEKPSIILRKNGVEYAGVVISATSGANVFFRRLYSFIGTQNPQTLVATQGVNAVIEPGQFMGAAPTIPQPDLSTLDLVTIGAAPRVVDMDANTYLAKSNINYPLVDSAQNAGLSLQTDDPANTTKRSIYVPLKSQLYSRCPARRKIAILRKTSLGLRAAFRLAAAGRFLRGNPCSCAGSCRSHE